VLVAFPLPPSSAASPSPSPPGTNSVAASSRSDCWGTDKHQMRGVGPQDAQSAPPPGTYSMRVHVELVGDRGAARKREMRIAKNSDFQGAVLAEWTKIAQKSMQEGEPQPAQRSAATARGCVCSSTHHPHSIRCSAPEHMHACACVCLAQHSRRPLMTPRRRKSQDSKTPF
jgi:hypothetical protein